MGLSSSSVAQRELHGRDKADQEAKAVKVKSDLVLCVFVTS